MPPTSTAWPALVLLAGLAAAPSARAQTPTTGMTGVPTEHQQAITAGPRGAPVASAPDDAGETRTTRGAHKTAQQRFEDANTTHDGHLTEAQAKSAHLRGVATHFAEIDKSHRGYITFEEIRAWRAERRAARKAAKAAHSAE